MRNRIAATVLLAVALAGMTAAAAAADDDNANRLTGLKLSGDKPIQIDADRLEVRENDSIAIFTGGVTVAQGTTLMKSGKLTVHYSKKGGGSAATGSAAIERLEATGKVYVKSDKQVATGDVGTFDMRSEVLVITGKKVVLSEGDNIAVGCKLTVEMKSGQARLDSCDNGSGGRVTIVLTPQNTPKPGDKAKAGKTKKSGN